MVHIFLVFVFLSIPTWPIYILRYGVYIPLCLAFLWLVCDGCPLSASHTHLINEQSFSQSLYTYIYPSVTKSQSDHMNCFLLILITVIGFVRIQYTS